MNPDSIRQERTTVSLAKSTRRNLELLSQKKGLCKAEIMRVGIDVYVTEELMKLQVIEHSLIEEITLKQDLEESEIKLKNKKIETQQQENFFNPHVMG